MWLVRTWQTGGVEDKNIAYEDFYDEEALFKRIDELLDDEVLFEVYICKCVLDRS